MLLLIIVEACLILCKLYIYPTITWIHVCLPVLLYLAWKISGLIISVVIVLLALIYTFIKIKVFKKQ